MEYLSQLQQAFENLPIEEALKKTVALFPAGTVKFSTSLGQEDQVLTDIIARNKIGVNIFTIDTGRLFNETYETWEKTEARYKIRIQPYFPQAEAVQNMVSEKGINLFYESVENRQTCCGIRKVEPLNRALQGTTVWITGLRASQNDHRKSIPMVEWLPDKKMYKINPLLHWSYEEILDYIKKNNVPYNPLHDKGFISIGCAPCTRAIEPGEDPRAGRWWWEASHKECGLHLVK
ncbi:phosphoadenylyl-sulfate reductase [Chitinophagaceae bacterium LB-8]|uniref:Adenosine 5'-phosphosulfate reductase n=1 Tax=Paraflavisolibacter caeni TaxID=2982496 RepID=A0A9X2XNC1_9BACT|nr:phosphoadenylyl-sulfate reductase [Paraflavisolibacter caeni]MCU7547844.1 phosphoadenylyl-sulfate reductase [Paraflavisolibacter caeni]